MTVTEQVLALFDLGTVVTGLLSGGLFAGLLGWVKFFREDRRADRVDQRAETTDGVNVVASLWTQVATLQTQVIANFADGQAAREDAAAARREVDWLRSTFASLVRPLVAWIDLGAQPPPPAVPDELRRILADVDQHPTSTIAPRGDVS